MHVPKYAYITPVLKERHWLPARERVRAVNGRGPLYLHIYTLTRLLRSAGTKQLKRPKAKLLGVAVAVAHCHVGYMVHCHLR